MSTVASVNLGTARPTGHSDIGYTGIDKRPATGPVQVRAPGPKGVGGSGLVGDRVCDLRHHGGDHQAVYASAREDLDRWAAELGRPRIPCRTFAGWLGERDWVKTFTARAVPGAYLRVIEPGFVESGYPLRVVHRPDHDVTVGVTFRALTTEPDLLPRLLAADALEEEAKDRARRRQPFV